MPLRADAPSTVRKRQVWLGLKYAVAVGAVVLAGFLLYRTLSQYEWHELVAAVSAVSFAHLSLALGFTAASYLALTGFDWLGLRYAGSPLPWRWAALASFCSLSLGHNIGFAALSSGTIRYRFYSRWGVGAAAVAWTILFCALTVAVGLTTLAGLALLLSPDTAADVTGLPQATVQIVGGLCLAATTAYLAVAFLLGGRSLRLRKHEVKAPEFRLALAQTVIGTLNFAFVAAALHQTVLSVADVPYLQVATVYVSANVATLITHAPGGLGVIESVVLFLLPHANMIGAVLVFRFVYYLLPLVLGGMLFVASELLAPRLFRDPAPDGR